MPAIGVPRPISTSLGSKVAATRRHAKGSSRPECSKAASAWNALRLGKPLSMPKEQIFKILASCRQHAARLTPHEQSQVEAIRREQARPKSAKEKIEDLAYHAVSSGLAKDVQRKAEWDRLANAPGRHEIRSAGQQAADEAKAKVVAQRRVHGDLRHKAAEAGRQLTQYLDENGRIKPRTNKAAVRSALDRFSRALARIKGDRSKAVSDAGRFVAHVRKQVERSDAIQPKPVQLTRSIDSPAGNLRSSARMIGPSEAPAIAGRIGPQLPVREQAQEHRRRAGLTSDRVTAVLAKANKAYRRSRTNARRALKAGNEPLARKHVERAIVREQRLERAMSFRNRGF